MPEFPGQTIYPPTGYPLPPPPPPPYIPPTPPVEPPPIGGGPLAPGNVYTCQYCGTRFSTLGAMTTHRAACPLNPANMPEPEPEAGINTCPHCGQDFPTVDALAIHIVVCPLNPANLEGGEGMPEDILSPWPPGSPEQMEEEYGRWPGFGTALGLFGRQYLSPHEQYQAGLQPGLETLYDVSGRMAGAGGFPQYDPAGMFSQWAPQYARDPRAMYGRAQSMMGNIFGMDPEQRATAEVGYGGGDLGSLLQMALRTQLGKQTAGWMAGKVPGERQSWLAQYPQQQGPSFLDYIREKYGLGQWI